MERFYGLRTCILRIFFVTLLMKEEHKNKLMKITKIKTKVGEFQSPVSTELELMVERMRSKETKKVVAMQGKDLKHL